jgi:hypothetical protein
LSWLSRRFVSYAGNAITSAQAGIFHERLSLKPQFQADHIAKSGWLKKLKIKWGWNRRWFVLQGENLVYYRSPQHAQPSPSEVCFAFVLCRLISFFALCLNVWS